MLTNLLNILLSIVGIASGVLVAGGLFALISSIGIISRLSSYTVTERYVWIYEDMVVIGGVIGNIAFNFGITLLPWIAGFWISGLFKGIFVGCVTMALAEALNVIPIFLSRVKIKMGLSCIILSFAIGKFFGSLYQLLK